MRDEIGIPHWNDGRPVVLVAGGPSLRGFDLSRLALLDAWLVGVNESIFHLPRCDCGVTADRVFIEQRFDRVREKIAGGMEMIVATNTARCPSGALLLKRNLGGKLSNKPTEINTCGTSGYAALNVAYLKRAKRVLMLGYDYSHDGSHYFADYEWRKPPKRADCWAFWAKFYESTRPQLEAAKVEVFNASPKSMITAFRRGTIEDGIKWVSDGAVDVAA